MTNTNTTNTNTTNTNTAGHRSLYEVTGDIKDINTMLVPRAALATPAQGTIPDPDDPWHGYPWFENTSAALAAPARHPGDMRKYVEAFAAKSGWNPGSGEGAFEYAQRICYSQGFEDATVQSQRKTHAAPRWQAVPVRTPLTDRQIGAVIDEVAITSRYGNHHFGRWMDFARAIEQAHGIKATNQESNK